MIKYTRVIVDLKTILNDTGTEAGIFNYIPIIINLPSGYFGGYGWNYGYDYGGGL